MVGKFGEYSRTLGDVFGPERVFRLLSARKILEHWEMCSVRNWRGAAGADRGILEHWEMCSVRNLSVVVGIGATILEHWEMCSVRNKNAGHGDARLILEHWEMCSVRNISGVRARRAYSRTLGDVFGPERHDEDSELPSGSGAQGGVANPNPCKF